MKVEETSDGLNIFLSNIIQSDIDWNNKKEIEKIISNLFKRLKTNYKINLQGFYKVKIYPNKIGTYIETIKLDEDNYDGSEIEFRIIVVFNKEMYLKTEDYFSIENVDKIFYNNNFYINLDDIDNYIEVADIGEIVLDNEIDFNNSKYIKKDYF